MSELVSVIIPTYNRYNLLLETVDSITKQTYKNIEIIIVDDCSPDERYLLLENTLKEKYPSLIIHIVRNESNSLKIKGFTCTAMNRNIGLKKSSGEYIAFCDDDDIWLPYKLDIQIKLMKEYKVEMSSTEGYFLDRPLDQYEKENFDLSKFYLYNGQKYYAYLSRKLNIINFPLIWDKKFLLIHNSMINSSVVISRKLYNQVGLLDEIKNGGEDYIYWLKCLDYTNSIYVQSPCFGYTGYNTKIH